jgi:hypothetical protein
LELIDTAVKETDEYQIFRNLEAQHRYLTWRTEKVVWIYLKLLPILQSCVYPCVHGNILKVGSRTRCFEEVDRGHTSQGRLNLTRVLFLYNLVLEISLFVLYYRIC